MVTSQEPAFAQIRTRRAHELIVDQLQQQILGGQLPPGSRLPSERALMAQFHVSRPTIREALRVAENMGLIAVRPGDPAGSQVLATPSLGISNLLDGLLKTGCTSPLELIELRLLIDSAAAALATASPTRSVAAAARIHHQMESTTDLNHFAELDLAFHLSFLEASGNQIFLIIYRSILAPMQTLIEGALQSTQLRREDTLRDHAAILDAIRRRDLTSATTNVRQHLRNFYSRLLSPEDKKRLSLFFQALGDPS